MNEEMVKVVDGLQINIFREEAGICVIFFDGFLV